MIQPGRRFFGRWRESFDDACVRYVISLLSAYIESDSGALKRGVPIEEFRIGVVYLDDGDTSRMNKAR